MDASSTPNQSWADNPNGNDPLDQTFGRQAAERAEQADQLAAQGKTPQGDEAEERPVEPHAAGKA